MVEIIRTPDDTPFVDKRGDRFHLAGRPPNLHGGPVFGYYIVCNGVYEQEWRTAPTRMADLLISAKELVLDDFGITWHKKPDDYWYERQYDRTWTIRNKVPPYGQRLEEAPSLTLNRVEALARLIAAEKMQLVEHPLGNRLPEQLWLQCMPAAEAIMQLIKVEKPT